MSHADGEMADEIGDEDDRAGEQGHEEEFAVGVIGGDLVGHFVDARLDGLAIDEDVVNVFLHG